ncbi:MAG: BlaI/MecI/CopY family transcriptional regulator [Acidobacteria bacterium]|nr:BlaI/MecI/CopY family transcriptional regulator [Acidobacteriota bacterium]
MPKRKQPGSGLTPLELEIMHVLWRTGPANVQTVLSGMEGRDLAYTTVQTMLNILHRKGKVSRRLKDRAYYYQPVLSRKNAVGQAIGEMLDKFFDGSADRLVLSLLETRHLTKEKLERIQALASGLESEKKGTGHD